MTTLDDLHAEQNKVYQSIGTPKEYKPGKSIVTSCYRQEITGTYILLTELKRLGFNCPIEVFYREGELIDDEVQELTRLYPDYVVFKKLKKTFEPFTDRWGNQKGWATKVYAILESEYEENFWIDSDNFPIRNCLDLFEDAEYKDAWIGTIHIAEVNDSEVEFGFIVDADHRGHGIADRMMNEALLWTRNRGFSQLYMHCLSWNAPIKRLCIKHGMELHTESGETDTVLDLEPADFQSYTEEMVSRNRQAYRMMIQTFNPLLKEAYV